ncbi:MAG: hypothetical protein ABSC53_03625 [Bacteroidota bacterium]
MPKLNFPIIEKYFCHFDFIAGKQLKVSDPPRIACSDLLGVFACIGVGRHREQTSRQVQSRRSDDPANSTQHPRIGYANVTVSSDPVGIFYERPIPHYEGQQLRYDQRDGKPHRLAHSLTSINPTAGKYEVGADEHGREHRRIPRLRNEEQTIPFEQAGGPTN